VCACNASVSHCVWQWEWGSPECGWRLMGAIISMPKTLSDEESLPGDRPWPIHLRRSGHLPGSEPTYGRRVCVCVWEGIPTAWRQTIGQFPSTRLVRSRRDGLTSSFLFWPTMSEQEYDEVHLLRYWYFTSLFAKTSRRKNGFFPLAVSLLNNNPL